MEKTNTQIVQELLAGATKPEVVNALVAPNATYLSLTYHNPDLKKLMPYAGRHEGEGPAAILYTFQTVNKIWKVEKFEPQQILADGDNVAIFGSFTLTSTTLGKTFTSPFSILATVKNGQVTYMQYMEDTFGTGATFHVSGVSKFKSDPAGGEEEIGPTPA